MNTRLCRAARTVRGVCACSHVAAAARAVARDCCGPGASVDDSMVPRVDEMVGGTRSAVSIAASQLRAEVAIADTRRTVVIVDKTRLRGAACACAEVVDAAVQESLIATSRAERLCRTATSNDPDAFSAVREQLGLQLKPTTGSVEMLVIDSVEHPTAD